MSKFSVYNDITDLIDGCVEDIYNCVNLDTYEESCLQLHLRISLFALEILKKYSR